jgi:DNA-binding CsgD family transcriptional regulator
VLKDLLADRWADLFISDPSGLARSVARLPRFLTNQSGLFPVAMRILAAAGPERMDLPLPTLEPNYARDRTAQRLREYTDRLYRNPGTRALSIGMLEISHLRLAGHYGEAADAALRLRAALSLAVGSHQINPILSCLVELHCGMSLHLAGRSAQASLSYEAALAWAGLARRPFLEANTTANLALLAAQEGDTVASRAWLARHALVDAKVGWGRRMVGRGADLARAHLAIAALDLEALDNILDSLPDRLDSDEFWSVHAWSQGMRHILGGDPASALSLVETTRRDRPHASASPLAMRKLTHVQLLARISQGDLSAPQHSLRWPEQQYLTALRHVIMGMPDKALAILQDVPWEGQGPRHRHPASYLEIVARTSAKELDPEGAGTIASIHARDGELIDLLPLRQLGLASTLEQLLDPDSLAVLNGFPNVREITRSRPVLTDRETAILRMLRQGMSRSEIAAASFRSENTVKAQLRGLYKKLGASTSEQAREMARFHGF